MNHKKEKRLYIIFDARAIDNTDDAAVMEACESLAEATAQAPNYGEGCHIWSYRDVEGQEELEDERYERTVYSDSFEERFV